MLVRSTDHIRTVIPVNSGVDFHTFEPYVNAAEDQFMIPVLGTKLYDELDTAITEDNGTDAQKALLKRVRYSLVHLTMFKGFDMLNVQFDSSGFERLKDNGIYRYQEENLKNTFKNEGYNGIDTLLEYLQKNITTFGSFVDSAFYTNMKGNFFPTTFVFNQVYGIGNSRLVFLQVSKFFNQVIDFKIKPLLGETLYNLVVAEMKKTANQDTQLMALVPYIQKPLAYLAVAEGFDELGLQITEKGLFFETQVDNSDSHIKTAQISDNKRLVVLDKARLNGTRYLEVLLNFLKQNADSYPDFTQTDLENTNPYRRDNTDKKTFWA